jgi:hypothetical protein
LSGFCFAWAHGDTLTWVGDLISRLAVSFF